MSTTYSVDSRTWDAHLEACRSFIAANMSSYEGYASFRPLADDVKVAKAREFQRRLFDSGLAGITWPAEYGGQGLPQPYQDAFDQLSSNYVYPHGVFGLALGICGPTILEIGTHAQKARYLEPILRGQEIWCQLLSEPGAGSDLASVRTVAERRGEKWVVNGQKTWTTNGAFADQGLLLARSTPGSKRSRGLSLFAVDMRAPGVEVRPIRDMSGTFRVNDVFLDDVELDEIALLGDEGEGWHVMATVLKHERIFGSNGRKFESSDFNSFNLIALATREGISVDAVTVDKLVGVFEAELAVDLYAARIAEEAGVGNDPGPRGSVGQLALTGMTAVAAEVTHRMLQGGLAAPVGDEGVMAEVTRHALFAVSDSIGGGTSEIQRNIIGERILGLPREPRAQTLAESGSIPAGSPQKGMVQR